MKEERWVRIDESSDVAGSIRHALRSAAFVGEDPLAVKWVMLALHSALQGACICHLTTTAQPIGALTQKSADEWWAWLNRQHDDPDPKRPQTQLMGLPDLLKTVRKPNTLGNGAQAPGITISDSELQWLRHIHDQVRNQFVHFEPMGWSLDVSGIPELGRLIARIIGEMVAADWAFRHLALEDRATLRDNLAQLAAMNWLPAVPCQE